MSLAELFREEVGAGLAREALRHRQTEPVEQGGRDVVDPDAFQPGIRIDVRTGGEKDPMGVAGVGPGDPAEALDGAFEPLSFYTNGLRGALRLHDHGEVG